MNTRNNQATLSNAHIAPAFTTTTNNKAHGALKQSIMNNHTQHEWQQTLTFVGGGNMGGSLIQGLLKQGYPSQHLRVADPNQAVLSPYRYQGVQCGSDTASLCEGSDAIILAVKPQIMPQVMANLSTAIQPAQLIISVAAGITIQYLQQQTHAQQAVVRAMPNTPALIGAGITGLCASDTVSDSQRQLTAQILGAVGTTLWIEDESLMDAVTAVSGSGPAYFFLIIEALTAAGVAQGLPESQAKQLALSTGLGALRMASETEEDAAELRRRVTSPGGTTAAALKVLEDGGMRQLMADAVAAATQRGVELAEQANNNQDKE